MILDFRVRLDYHVLIVVLAKWEVLNLNFYFVCLEVQ